MKKYTLSKEEIKYISKYNSLIEWICGGVLAISGVGLLIVILAHTSFYNPLKSIIGGILGAAWVRFCMYLEDFIRFVVEEKRTEKLIHKKSQGVFSPRFADCILPSGNEYISVVSDIPSSPGLSGKHTVVILDPKNEVRFSQFILSLAVSEPLEKKEEIGILYRECGYVICNVSGYNYKQIQDIIAMLDKIYHCPEYMPENKRTSLGETIGKLTNAYTPENSVFPDSKDKIEGEFNETNK